MFDYYAYPPSSELNSSNINTQAIKPSQLPPVPHPSTAPNFPHSNIPHYHPRELPPHYTSSYNHYRYRNKCGGTRRIFPLLVVGAGTYLIIKGFKNEMSEVKNEIIVTRAMINNSNGLEAGGGSYVNSSGVDDIKEQIRKKWGWHHKDRKDFSSQFQQSPQQQQQYGKEERRI